MERNSKELAKDQPLIKQLLELFVSKADAFRSGDLIVGLGVMIKLPEVIRIDHDMQRDIMAKVTLSVPHLQPWQVLAIAAALSKLEGPEYGLNVDNAMLGIKKRVPKL